MSDGGKGDNRRPTDENAVSNNWGTIFGDKSPKRGSFIFDPKTNKLVEKSEYYGSAEPTSAYVMPDIQGYQSQVTGEWIGSRSQHRQHLKEHRLVEVGNEIKAHTAKRETQIDRAGIKRDLIDAVHRHWK